MRIITAALAAILAISVPAFAGDAEGRIKSVDTEKMTVTLDDGKTYKLPAEMDVSAVEPGLTILLAYDVVDGVNQITDLELSE